MMKIACFFYFIDEQGDTWFILLKNDKFKEYAGLSGSFEWRTDIFDGSIDASFDQNLSEMKAISDDLHMSIEEVASMKTVVKEFGEETGQSIEIHYVVKHSTLIDGKPWIGPGKIRTDKLDRRRNGYVPFASVLNLTEWLKSNYKGATISDCANEFIAGISKDNGMLCRTDGENCEADRFPVHSLPINNMWEPHRRILTNMNSGHDSLHPTLMDVLGPCTSNAYHKKIIAYKAIIFKQKYLSLASAETEAAAAAARWLKKYYPTLVNDASTPSEVLETIKAYSQASERIRNAYLRSNR